MRRESVEYLNPLFVLVVLVDAEVRVIKDGEEKRGRRVLESFVRSGGVGRCRSSSDRRRRREEKKLSNRSVLDSESKANCR
jgi:hypothetical protein